MRRRYQPHEVLPHLAPMLLLDEIIDWDDEWILTRVNRSNTDLFDIDDAPASGMASLEYLCQSAAAHAGIRQLEQGKPVTIGFIIGARLFSVDQAAWLQQQEFEIRVDQTFRDSGGIGLYASRMYVANQPGKTVAEATIKAAMPDDPLDVIKQTMLRPRQVEGS